MNKIFVTIITLISCTFYSQEKINFKTKNTTENFVIANNLIYIETDEPLSKFENEKVTDRGNNFIIIETKQEDYKEKLLNLSKSYKNVEPVLIYEDGVKQICFDEIIIKTKSNLEEILKGIDFTFKVNEFEVNQYIVKLNNYNTRSTFELINRLYKDERLEYVEPNFIRINIFLGIPNDPFLSSQWAMQTNHMNVVDAWSIATGTGIKVAVLDEGIDLSHPDLQSNLLPGYDATVGSSNGGCESSDPHGTACAGIIGAVANNGIGITGIAYNSKILPIRIGKSGPAGTAWTSDTWASDGINWAWLNGADVLSNSWRHGSGSSTLDLAINNAVTRGRSGKGCVVVFATGNNNSEIVAYPAKNPQVIAVGASSQCNQRKSSTSCDGETFWGSNYGKELDVVAPGVNIYTTDIVGTTGYETGNYHQNYNGTSAACPNVAGVVALILSLKPSLTGIEARNVLERTADKIGNYNYVTNKPNGNWDNEMGYGRVNAFRALRSLVPDLFGPDVVCGNTDFLFFRANSYPTNWSCTSNLTIISSDKSNITIAPISSTISEYGSITAIVNGQVYVKNVWIGKPYIWLNEIRTPTYEANYIDINLSGPFFESQGIASTTWTKIASTGNIIFSGSGFKGFAKGKTYKWDVTVKVTATNICGTTEITKFIPSILYLQKSSSQLNIVKDSKNFYTIFPNPSKDFINIDIKNQENFPQKDLVISGKLFDLMGFSKSKVDILENKARFSVESLKKGIYILKIYIGNEIETHQIAVE